MPADPLFVANLSADGADLLRAGHSTTAAMAVVGHERTAAQTRHSRISPPIEYYIRAIEALKVTSSRDLGL